MSWGPIQILVILVIVLLLFGTKKIRNLGADLGAAIKGFRKSVKDDPAPMKREKEEQSDTDKTD